MVAMFAVTAGVVTLKLIDRALPGVPELSELLLVMMIYLAVGYTQIKGRHVRLDMLLERASPRTRNIMEVVASSLVIIIVAFTCVFRRFLYISYIHCIFVYCAH